jgi:hypothetical protein
VGELEQYGRMCFIGTWCYHLSRGEMVTAAVVLVLRAEAQTKGDLDALEQALGSVSKPLRRAERFPPPGEVAGPVRAALGVSGRALDQQALIELHGIQLGDLAVGPSHPQAQRSTVGG